tara:strand:+ start:87 stop:656 length:570 start_codon:yes stop_codon:yes gene_type:complete
MDLLYNDLTIDLDLAFLGIKNSDLLNIENDLKKYLFLNNQSYWHHKLITWLKYIRQEITLDCPAIVRQRNSFSMGVQLTDDLIIRSLNNKWRHSDQITDVLSFPVVDESMFFHQDLAIELGDIVVSIPMAYRQAIDQNHSLEKELLWLISHGLLHLLGWDHPDSSSLSEMLTLQEQLLQISGNLRTVRI